MVAETPEELQLLHDKQAIEAEAGLETHVLEGAELRRFAPYLAEDLLGATYCPAEGHANPFLAAPLFALPRGRARRHRPHQRRGDRRSSRGFVVTDDGRATIRARAGRQRRRAPGRTSSPR